MNDPFTKLSAENPVKVCIARSPVCCVSNVMWVPAPYVPKGHDSPPPPGERREETSLALRMAAQTEYINTYYFETGYVNTNHYRYLFNNRYKYRYIILYLVICHCHNFLQILDYSMYVVCTTNAKNITNQCFAINYHVKKFFFQLFSFSIMNFEEVGGKYKTQEEKVTKIFFMVNLTFFSAAVF
jgi:hypothetical protein